MTDFRSFKGSVHPLELEEDEGVAIFVEYGGVYRIERSQG